MQFWCTTSICDWTVCYRQAARRAALPVLFLLTRPIAAKLLTGSENRWAMKWLQLPLQPSCKACFKSNNTRRCEETKCSPFLSRVSILLLTRDIDIVILSVCLSVRLSVRDMLVLYENGLTYRHSFSPYGSPIIPVLGASNIFTKFRRGHPLRGR